jgi:hypothetical protein
MNHTKHIEILKCFRDQHKDIDPGYYRDYIAALDYAISELEKKEPHCEKCRDDEWYHVPEFLSRNKPPQTK